MVCTLSHSAELINWISDKVIESLALGLNYRIIGKFSLSILTYHTIVAKM